MRHLVPALLVLALSLPNTAHAQLAPLNDQGMTYGHVHLNVSDVDQHAQLYADQFGGEVYQRGPLTVVRFPSMILLLSERAPTGGSQESVLDHFGFKVRDIEPVLERWRAAGLEVQSEFTGAEGFPNAYLMAPDSVRIELQEDPEMEDEVAGYHVHFFTEGYEDLMAWYVENFGVEPFQRGTIPTTANAPGMNLSFGGTRTERVPTRGRSIDHIGFEFADLDAAVRKLEANGVHIDSPVREIPSLGLKIAFLTDPAGTYVELTEGLIDY